MASKVEGCRCTCTISTLREIVENPTNTILEYIRVEVLKRKLESLSSGAIDMMDDWCDIALLYNRYMEQNTLSLEEVIEAKTLLLEIRRRDNYKEIEISNTDPGTISRIVEDIKY